MLKFIKHPKSGWKFARFWKTQDCDRSWIWSL